MNESIINALKIILAKSPTPAVGERALQAIAAAKNNSPVIETRYTQVLQMALANHAEFSPDEMAILTDAISSSGDEAGVKKERRTGVVQFRVTTSERAMLNEAAAGRDLSDYIRERLGL